MLTPVRYTLPLLAVALVGPPAAAAQRQEDDVVRRVIQDAYVTGVFVTRDAQAVRRGFHPEFVLSVLDDGDFLVVTLDQWLDRMKLDGRRSTDTVRSEFEYVDVTGNTAAAKLRLYVNGRQRYTDYLSLYRFPEGWRIVQKVFHGHD